MKILVVGAEANLNEFKEKFTDGHDYGFFEGYTFDEQTLLASDLVFDFYLGDNPEQFDLYADFEGGLFINSPKISLAELAYYQEGIRCSLYGFNGLPTFVNRPKFEVSSYQDSHQLGEICQQLGTEYVIVDDRVGMVTPRVIFMVINEAFYTLQEGTASIEDIDKGMKLGTNYPYGPFEWCDLIGVQHVYEVLEAVYEDTKDERYKICPLLKKKYLKT